MISSFQKRHDHLMAAKDQIARIILALEETEIHGAEMYSVLYKVKATMILVHVDGIILAVDVSIYERRHEPFETPYEFVAFMWPFFMAQISAIVALWKLHALVTFQLMMWRLLNLSASDDPTPILDASVVIYHVKRYTTNYVLVILSQWRDCFVAYVIYQTRFELPVRIRVQPLVDEIPTHIYLYLF